MNFEPQRISGLVIITPQVFGDDRGFFLETWHREKFADVGINEDFVQSNHSTSGCNVLRGLHYQIEQPQGKLVRVIKGGVYDVAVDIRRSSPTFGQWMGVELTAENKKMFWIPIGFAHGFYVTSEMAEFTYSCTDFYAPEHERCLLWSDPELAIDWPVLETEPPRVSEKDMVGTPLCNAECYL